MSDEKTPATKSEAAAIIAAGTAMAGPFQAKDGGVPIVVVPEGYKIEDIEPYLDAPARARGTFTAETPEAFIAYFSRFADDDAKGGTSMVFARSGDFHVEGIIDWHSPGDTPGFGDHRVVYEAPRSDEWKIWTKPNGVAMKQTDFSRFIEDNVKDIVEPDGADVLEIARQLEVKKKVEFASAERLSDGQREFTYKEDVQGSTRRGTLAIPEEFKLGIPVFVDGEPYEVTARLRYRIAEGQLVLWYDLLRPHEIKRDAFAQVVKGIDEGVKVDVLMGMAQ